MRVSVIIPTYKEVDNLPSIIPEVYSSLDGRLEEILIVDDDSQDGTLELIHDIEHLYPLKLIVRKEERGLGSAVLEGIRRAKSSRVLIMDADGQHPACALLNMADALESSSLVVGSRYIRGGGIVGWNRKRRILSRIASLLGRPLCGIKDSSSGLFGLDRTVLNVSHAKVEGFKVGLEIFSRMRGVEVPYVFGPRREGESKLTAKQGWLFLKQLARLYWWKFDLTRMAKFCIVGTVGLGVNSLVLWLIVGVGGVYYLLGNIGAVSSAMLLNFTLNKKWTFKR